MVALVSLLVVDCGGQTASIHGSPSYSTSASANTRQSVHTMGWRRCAEPEVDKTRVRECVVQTRKGSKCLDCCEEVERDYEYCKMEFGVSHECARSAALGIKRCVALDCDMSPSP